MIEVEVQINNFKDKENYDKTITIIRNNQEQKVTRELLQKGDKYKISKERYEHLSKKGIVVKAKKETKEKGE